MDYSGGALCSLTHCQRNKRSVACVKNLIRDAMPYLNLVNFLFHMIFGILIYIV